MDIVGDRHEELAALTISPAIIHRIEAEGIGSNAAGQIRDAYKRLHPDALQMGVQRTLLKTR